MSELNLVQIKEQVKHIMLDFQINDLNNCIKGGGNFLAAIGLMVATESLGGLITGTPKSGSKRNFEEGFKRLGDSYRNLYDNNKDGVLDVYRNVRCGLIHRYVPSNVEGMYAGYTDLPGIIEQDGAFKILPASYVRDLETAVNRLLVELESDTKLQGRVRKTLKQIPVLA